MREALICRTFFENQVNRLKDAPNYSSPRLSCYCAIASAYLCSRLRRLGYRSCFFVLGEYNGHDHCWVELDGRIIDITATQFKGITRVVYIPDTEISRRDYRKRYHGRAAIKQLKRWPREQVAFLNIKRKWYDGNYYRYLDRMLRLYLQSEATSLAS